MAINRTRPILLAATAFAMMSVTLTVPAISLPADRNASGTGLDKSDLATVRGEVGIAVVDTARNKQFLVNQEKPFPMQSVCKLPISIAILRLADSGRLSVQDKITIRKKDLVPLHSPIKEAIKGEASDFTIRDLISRAISDSDNTACDALISRAGGPASVYRILREAGIKGVRLDRPEGKLQPDSLKIAKYLTDPRDTAAPEGMVDLLQKLHGGKLLSKTSTSFVLEDLFNCKTGPKRLRAGLPSGWKLAHKTGTGCDVKGQNTATNDVGIIVGPKGETIYVAVFIKGSRAKIEVREALIAKVAAEAVAGDL
jgi:beta-lactamase class A